MMHAELLGSHCGYNGGSLTIQELLDLLKRIPAKARHNYLMVCFPDGVFHDVTGISFTQSDQAEKWDFKVYVDTEGHK